MPRIKKIKFESAGKYHHDTTFTGYITLDLLYDAKNEHFYFDMKQLKEEIKTIEGDGVNRFNFRNCVTQAQAIAIVSNFIYERLFVDAEKYLAIFINSDVLKGRAISYSDAQQVSSLVLGYSKFLKVTNSKTGDRSMVKCNPIWEIARDSPLYNNEGRYTFIKWTEHREQVLLSAINSLDNLKVQVESMFKKALDGIGLETMLDSSVSLLENNPKH
jgi:hypothetical protein